MKYLKLLRVKHYIKNFLIFLPLLFGKQLFGDSIITTLTGFVSFCMATSFIYIVNDIKDVEKDRNHPRKKNRPIASGEIGVKKALIIAFVCLVLSAIYNYLAGGFNFLAYGLILAYIFINILYTFFLKNVVLVDAFIIAIGFIIRVYYGAVLISVPVSNWLFLTLLSGSLFLAFGKRRNELIYSDDKSREVLKDYSVDYLNSFINICISLVIVFYSLWVIEQDAKYLYLTIPIVIYIAMKYSLIASKEDSDGDPTNIILGSKSLLISIAIYVIIMIVLMVV